MFMAVGKKLSSYINLWIPLYLWSQAPHKCGCPFYAMVLIMSDLIEGFCGI